MTNERYDPFDGPITTEEELDTALKQLLTNAHENDVNPNGSWVVRNGAPTPDWEVQVFELAKRK